MTHRTGTSRYWEHRPSDHRAGMREYWHGPIVPLQEPRRSIWQRIVGSDRHD